MSSESPQAQPPSAVPGAAPVRHPYLLLWRWRRNPLRRPSDQLGAWISLGLVLAVLVAAPAAMWGVGDSAYRHYRSTAEHEARSRDHRPAVLTHDAPRHPEPGSDEAKKARYPVPVRYTGPDGVSRTGTTEVQPGLAADSTVLVWVDAQGRLTEPPLTAEQIRSRTMGWAILAFLGVGLAGLAAHAATGLVLRRRNLAGWDAAWADTAPRWSRYP
ncbi:Rv1733c family protein [Streptomyces sp. enrichment culture]|uniref:Rv1733c family protein n=1 Tax=Streptomyces sp. enrichment culture TaxID=1795815 RepID=UPI003F56B8E7